MRIAREEAGYEVRAFADALGIAPSTVTRYEKGRARPKRLALKAWAELTDVPVHWLEFGLMEAAPLPPTAAVAVSGKSQLPRLDSNQQPAD
ncbi:helix-turn-helix domain-containing protein [Demequina sp. TMPB413]|uniref:helix-turn-helix domain-containing protein n=2 Tax=unclassified Demequina TaxID=2620311 RepID=UPI0035327C6A